MHNRPFYYKDPDGQFAVTFPLVTAAFGAAGLTLTGPAIVTIGCTIGAVTGTGVGLVLAWAVYRGFKGMGNTYYQVEADQQSEIKVEEKKGKRKGKDNAIEGGPPRDPSTANYLPDPVAEGPHTTLGTQQGRKGPYTQGATFDEKGKFEGRTDITDHGRADHPNPHYHPATGPNSAKSPAQPVL